MNLIIIWFFALIEIRLFRVCAITNGGDYLISPSQWSPKLLTISTHIIDLTVSYLLADYGTLPADELYFERKPESGNLGEID